MYPAADTFSHYSTTNQVDFQPQFQISPAPAAPPTKSGAGYSVNRRCEQTSISVLSSTFVSSTPPSSSRASKYPMLDSPKKEGLAKPAQTKEQHSARFLSGYVPNRQGFRPLEELKGERHVHPSAMARMRVQDPIEAENGCQGPSHHSTTTGAAYVDKSDTFRSIGRSTFRSMQHSTPSPTKGLTGYSMNRSGPSVTTHRPTSASSFGATSYRETVGRSHPLVPELNLTNGVKIGEHDLNSGGVSGYARAGRQTLRDFGSGTPSLDQEAERLARMTPIEKSRFRKFHSVEYDELSQVGLMRERNTTYNAAHNELHSKLRVPPTMAEMQSVRQHARSKSTGFSANRTTERVPSEDSDPRDYSSTYHSDFAIVSSGSPSNRRSVRETIAPPGERPPSTHPDLHQYDGLHPSVRKRLEKQFPYEMVDRHEHKKHDS